MDECFLATKLIMRHGYVLAPIAFLQFHDMSPRRSANTKPTNTMQCRMEMHGRPND